MSQGFNVLLLGGHQDQTVSARAYVNRKDKLWGKVRKIIDTIFFFQENHCYKSYQEDRKFAQEICNVRKNK